MEVRHQNTTRISYELATQIAELLLHPSDGLRDNSSSRLRPAASFRNICATTPPVTAKTLVANNHRSQGITKIGTSHHLQTSIKLSGAETQHTHTQP
jgi:hypothetical protein